MIRSFIAILLTFTIAVVGAVRPAYADSNNSALFQKNYQQNNSTYYTDSNYKPNNSSSDSNEAVDGFVSTIKWAAGAAAACYVLDAAATTVFPPAASLAAFCPTLAGMSGGAKAVTNIAH